MRNLFTAFIVVTLFFITTLPVQAAEKKQPNNPLIVLETSKGSITLILYPEKAPKTVANFLQYVDAGFYNGLIFHRVISGFMIQGGGFTADMQPKEANTPIKNEADNGLDNNRGTIAMARTSAPHSAGSQFFINHKNNSFLNFREKTGNGWGYTVFGEVVEGMAVVDAIAGVPTGNISGMQNVPIEAVIIKQAYRK